MHQLMHRKLTWEPCFGNLLSVGSDNHIYQWKVGLSRLLPLSAPGSGDSSSLQTRLPIKRDVLQRSCSGYAGLLSDLCDEYVFATHCAPRRLPPALNSPESRASLPVHQDWMVRAERPILREALGRTMKSKNLASLPSF